MRSAIETAIFTVGSSMALSILVKATFVMALGLGAAMVAKRQRAAFRHALLAGMFGVLLTLPLVSALAPPVQIAMRVLQSQSLTAPFVRTGGVASPVVTRAPGVPDQPRVVQWTVFELLTVGWIAGAVLFLVPVGVGLRQVRRLRRSGLPWAGGQSAADGVALDLGMGRRVEVMLHEALAGPMTCGAVRPAILLPVDAPEWDAEELRRAIVHELEHVMRRDWATHCLARAVCAIYWFHPLAWMAWRRLELEAERACDDAVLARSEATAYADQLVAVARRLSAAAKSPLLAMASRADLASRVTAVLDGGQRRGRAGVLCVTAALGVAVALVATVSPLRVVAAPQTAGSEARGARLRVDTMLVLIPVTVAYPNGNTVEGLSAGDFALTEDGVAQTVSIFEFQKTGTDAPSSYYLLGYYPRNRNADGQFRKIEITVKTATAAKLGYRDGYYAMKRPDTAPAVTPGAGVTPPPYDKPPVLIFKKDPEYSDEARKAKYQGTVMLDVQIDATGKVTNARTVRSLGLGLDEKATDAVEKWRFKPATKDGNPVATQAEVEVNFRLL